MVVDNVGLLAGHLFTKERFQKNDAVCKRGNYAVWFYRTSFYSRILVSSFPVWPGGKNRI